MEGPAQLWRRFARRLSRRDEPAYDWTEPQAMQAALAQARPMLRENRHELLVLGARGWPLAERFEREEYRVFRAPASLDPSRGPEDAFAALDALRREQSLGATACLVADPAWLPVARRLQSERAFAVLEESSLVGVDFARAARAIAGAFPSISVVLVTYNNRELNRLCLESLGARTEWPNLEIVVVDNGSSDGTPELLDEAERRMPNLKVIRNAENRGFAAASNAGAAAAAGEYLVFLNNDTIVTRGWATALVRHLASHPRLGLVGPVTNAIGNEAKVPVGYSDLSALPAWAAAWTRAHDGETFDVPMLAFFCLAMRRRVFEEVGPLDERFGPGLFEDDDYGRRARQKGWEIRCARDAFVHHWQGASFRILGEGAYLKLWEENQRKFDAKWGAARAAAVPRVQSQGLTLFLPSIGWDIPLFQRPHHLARAFARAGWVSVFDCSNAADSVDGFREVEPGLFLFKGEARALAEIPAPLLWSFPYNFDQTDLFPAGSRTVYDWIDDLSVFPHSKRLLRRNHERGLAEADLVTCVSRRLHEEALRRRPDALFLPNAVEYEHFAADAPEPAEDPEIAELVGSGRPVAGYYGALADWFDSELLEEVARIRPDWSFLLIGPELGRGLSSRRALLRRSNVRWIGPRPYGILPRYLSLFDVATIPFRINIITSATSPLKLFEYFAAGKPVVTTPMPECQAFPEVEIADGPRAFAETLDRARERGKDPEFRERLRRLGRENSWSARVAAVLECLPKNA